MLVQLASEPLAKTGRPLARRTQAHLRTRLRSLFTSAVEIDKLITTSPMRGVRNLKRGKPKSGGEALDFEQLLRFFRLGQAMYAAGMLRLWPAAFMAVMVGMRRGEVMGLTWEHIDFEHNRILVRQSRVMGLNGIELTGLKSDTSERDIYMPATLARMLRQVRRAQEQERKVAAEAWADTGAVFATQLGNWTDPSNLGRTVARVVQWSDPSTLQREQGKPWVWKGVPHEHRDKLIQLVQGGEALPKVSVHDLRHTYATLALRKRVPVEQVSKTLGHAQTSITLDIYRHVTAKEQQESVLDLFEIVSGDGDD